MEELRVCALAVGHSMAVWFVSRLRWKEGAEFQANPSSQTGFLPWEVEGRG